MKIRTGFPFPSRPLRYQNKTNRFSAVHPFYIADALGVDGVDGVCAAQLPCDCTDSSRSRRRGAESQQIAPSISRRRGCGAQRKIAHADARMESQDAALSPRASTLAAAAIDAATAGQHIRRYVLIDDRQSVISLSLLIGSNSRLIH